MKVLDLIHVLTGNRSTGDATADVSMDTNIGQMMIAGSFLTAA